MNSKRMLFTSIAFYGITLFFFQSYKQLRNSKRDMASYQSSFALLLLFLLLTFSAMSSFEVNISCLLDPPTLPAMPELPKPQFPSLPAFPTLPEPTWLANFTWEPQLPNPEFPPFAWYPSPVKTEFSWAWTTSSIASITNPSEAWVTPFASPDFPSLRHLKCSPDVPKLGALPLCACYVFWVLHAL